MYERFFSIVIWGKNSAVKKMGKNGAGLKTTLRVKILKIYYTTFKTPSCIVQPRKTMINTLPCSLQLPLSNSLRNFEFVYLKSDFAYLIFWQHLIIFKFFLDNQDY